MKLRVREQPKEASLTYNYKVTQDSHQANDSETLLNEMYRRAKSREKEQQACTEENYENHEDSHPLIKYTNMKEYRPSEAETEVMKFKKQQNRDETDSIENDFMKIKKSKKISLNERFKTDLCDQEEIVIEEVQRLKKQNQNLKNKVIKLQKKIITLESFEGEVEYLKKICFIQNGQVQKLRRMMKNLKHQKIQLQNQQNRHHSESVCLKFSKFTNDHIYIKDKQEEAQSVIKKAKCQHKFKRPANQHHKTQSVLYSTNQNNKSVPLKDIQNQMRKTLPSKQHSKNKREKSIYA